MCVCARLGLEEVCLSPVCGIDLLAQLPLVQTGLSQNETTLFSFYLLLGFPFSFFFLLVFLFCFGIMTFIAVYICHFTNAGVWHMEVWHQPT